MNNNDINGKLTIITVNILSKIKLDYQISIFDPVFTLSKFWVNLQQLKKLFFVFFAL